MRNGVVMAVDEINALGGLVGHKLKYIEVDDNDSTGDQVPTAFQRAIEVEKADVIFSGYHLDSAPEFDICANAGRAVLQQQHPEGLDRSLPEGPREVLVDLPDRSQRGVVRRRLRPLPQLPGRDRPVQAERTRRPLSCTATTPTAPSSAPPSMTRPRNWAGRSWMKETFTVGQVTDWGPLLSKVRDANPSVLFTVDYNPAENAAMIKSWVGQPDQRAGLPAVRTVGARVPGAGGRRGQRRHLGHRARLSARHDRPRLGRSLQGEVQQDAGLCQRARRLRPGLGLGQGRGAGRRSLRLQEGRQDDRDGHPPRRDRRQLASRTMPAAATRGR